MDSGYREGQAFHKKLGLLGAPSSFFGKIGFVLQNNAEINIYALGNSIDSWEIWNVTDFLESVRKLRFLILLTCL